jgi:hypothetical protein
MSSESERVYDPVLGKVVTRLKTITHRLKQEFEEKDRCVKQAEEILRQASRAHP